MKKQMIAVIGTLVLLLNLFTAPLLQVVSAENNTENKESVVKAAKQAAVNYVKVRYNRTDKDYEGWNIWTWEPNKEGKKVEFIGEDEEGAYAVIEAPKSAKEIGIILRKSVPGNEWSENYFGKNHFVNVEGNAQEVIIEHADKADERTLNVHDLEYNFENVNLYLHYYRFDETYEPWDIWGWIPQSNIHEGNGFTLDSEDEYGKIAKVSFSKMQEQEKIGFIIRKPDWSEKDVDIDRFVNVAYANNNGDIHAYVVQNDATIYYSAEDVVRNPAVSSAKLNSLQTVDFDVNVKLANKDVNVALKEVATDRVINGTVTLKEDLSGGTITTEETLDLVTEYAVVIEGYTSGTVVLGKVLDTKEFEEAFHYDGELGALYTKDKTTFALWAPTATEVKLALYGNDTNPASAPKEVVAMEKGEKGTWVAEQSGNLDGTYYTYLVTVNGKENEVTDPYALAVGVNGRRGMVADLDSTDPKGWETHKKPEFKNATDAVIYEMHIRDFTIDESSGVTELEYVGKYKGVTKEGTTIPDTDVKTGIDHLVELGVTHLHILPTFDHRSIDETKLDQPQYNWGYDPQNYNVPEGSYSTDPYNGKIRMTEFKQMVMDLHEAGIRVVLDVVYNHTGATADSHLNLAVPDYYYRQNANGGFANGSGCGNEVASERSMVRKMIVESIAYWAKEYGIDGFRFDLMGLHDIETMKQIRTELDKIDESIIMYGEGWNGGDSPLPFEDAAMKVNTTQYGDMQIAAFSDDIRDGIKGHVFQDNRPGFVNGEQGMEHLIKFGVVASTSHPEVKIGATTTPDYTGYGTVAWANQPYQSVIYASAHDNLTLFDKLQTTNPEATKEELVTMNKLAAGIILTSQGIPFLHAGDELARTKVNPDGSFNHNSYNAPDSVNRIDWTRKQEYNDLFEYYKGLIQLRKDHAAFRMMSTADIQTNLDFVDEVEKNVVAYTIDADKVGDEWDEIAVVFNANEEEVEVELPSEDWTIVVNGETAGTEELGTVKGNKVTVAPKSTFVLVDTTSFNGEGTVTPPTPDEDDKPGTDNDGTGDDLEKPGTDEEKPTVDGEKPGTDHNNPDEETPQTGDNMNIVLWIVVLIAAGAGFIYLKKVKRNDA